MPADGDEHGESQEIEQLREYGDVFFETGTEYVGQRQAAELTYDLPGNLNSGEQDVHAESHKQTDERFVNQQPAVFDGVLNRRHRRTEKRRRHQQRHRHGQ